MAVTNTCAKLVNGYDTGCNPPVRKYYQQAVLINKTDIDEFTITPPDSETETCNYKVNLTLKAGTTGYRISGPEAGTSFFGSFDKSRSDLGFPQYIHNASILLAGVSEAVKCILDSIDKGSFVVAFQLGDGTVEIFGIENGLTTGDYTYDVQGGGGGTAVVLSSLEDAPERYLPLIYESAVPGQENEDFDDAFAQTT